MGKPASKSRLVGYCRVSSEQQAEAGVSLAAQKARIQGYCDLYGLNLVAICTDAGESAKTLDRPALRTALAALDSGEADGILVTKLDRLTRSVVDLGSLVQDYFHKHQLHSVAEKIDTSSASGRMMLNLLTVVSQWERETVGERTSIALQHLKSSGVQLGRPAMGYARAETKGMDGRRAVAPVEEELETVQMIFDLREQGFTLASIARHLSNTGRATKRGGKWHPFTVSKILRRGHPSEPRANDDNH